MRQNDRGTILLVEDSAEQRRTLSGFLAKRGYGVIEAANADAALAAAGGAEVDLLLTDLRLGGKDGVDLLLAMREARPELQAIVLTAYGTVDDAVRAMRAGAYDFVSKPVELAHLEALLEKALEKAALTRENRSLREVVKSSGTFAAVVGQGPAIQKVLGVAAKVAPSKASILIQGESGTGKEVLARSIHLASGRRGKPFVTVNCAALPESLVESELFGHEAGAFTGAQGQRKGRFEIADSGTIFLDEIAEVPLHLQVKLLNVLQSGRFERVGGTTTINVDVRIVAATNRDVEAQVRSGAFREDLYYRLNVVGITLPPLRDRREDIGLLAQHFIAKHADLSMSRVRTISPEALELLRGHRFPGNVRELENWIARAMVMAEGDRLEREDFPALGQAGGGGAEPPGGAPGGLEDRLAALESSLIEDALSRCRGNQSAAARLLGINERAIRYKMKKHGLA
jgi:two-component system NtrC family response regulator